MDCLKRGMISFIIPAHNEERWIGGSMAAIRAGMAAIGEPYEIVVADDASTDGTAGVAEAHGARLVQVAHRQIAATRNAGAQAACGDPLFFVDADTLANEGAIRAGLEAMRDGAIGGGCMFTFDAALPVWARLLHPLAVALSRPLGVVGGCFLFCTRAAYQVVGGFCERYYWSEELIFIRALKRRGRFAVPRQTVVTSARKLRTISVWEVPAILYRWRFRPHRREALDIYYGKRGEECKRN
jgi:glycosyltransferase involved in cell wall biosynthesis